MGSKATEDFTFCHTQLFQIGSYTPETHFQPFSLRQAGLKAQHCWQVLFTEHLGRLCAQVSSSAEPGDCPAPAAAALQVPSPSPAPDPISSPWELPASVPSKNISPWPLTNAFIWSWETAQFLISPLLDLDPHCLLSVLGSNGAMGSKCICEWLRQPCASQLQSKSPCERNTAGSEALSVK